MRSPLRVLLLALALCLSLSLVAQQTKTKTKTEAGKTKTKTETNKTKMDANKAPTDSLPATTTTAMEGTGGGIGNMAAPYTATYSSQFTIGNPAHATTVLTLWKDWDEGNLDRNAAFFADTVVMETPDGMRMRGKDSLMLSGKQYRSSFTTVKSNVEAFMPLRSTDRNEDWVAIWGTAVNTGTNGQTTTERIHEIWRINKDGKVDYIRQFTAKPPTQ